MAQCFYSDLYKEVRDILYRDYPTSGFKFMLAKTKGPITCSGTATYDYFLADVGTQVTNQTETNSKFFATMGVIPAPGLKAIVDFKHRDQDICNVGLQYQNDAAAINTRVGLNANPVVDFSCMIRDEDNSYGADVSVNMADQMITNLSFGKREWNLDDASLNLYSSQLIAPTTELGCHAAHSFDTDLSSLTVGFEHRFDESTVVKACLNNLGKARASIKHEWWPKFLVTVAGEFDVRAIWTTAKMGLSLSLNK